VPLEEVEKYIEELLQPDPKSRSQLEEGKRLIPLDPNRYWGWHIVNYNHYRKIRDQAARREYFREAQRKYREKQRSLSQPVKDQVLTRVDEGGLDFSVPSSSTSTSSSSSKSRCTEKEAEDFCESLGLPRSDGRAMFLHWQEKGWAKIKDWKLTIRKWREWGYLPSQRQAGRNSQPRQMSAFEIEKRCTAITERISKIFRANGSKRVDGDGIDELKNKRDELKRMLTQ
jgi:hypothetical protein